MTGFLKGQLADLEAERELTRTRKDALDALQRLRRCANSDDIDAAIALIERGTQRQTIMRVNTRKPKRGPEPNSSEYTVAVFGRWLKSIELADDEIIANALYADRPSPERADRLDKCLRRARDADPNFAWLLAAGRVS